MRYWNELARAAQIEPQSLYAKVNGKTGWTLDDLHALEKALGANILYIVGTVHYSDVDDPEPWI